VPHPLRSWATLIIAVVAIGGCAATSSTATPAPVTSREPPVSHAVMPVIRGRLVTTANWQQTAQGFRLRVQPSRYGRASAAAAPSVALRQALSAAAPTPLTLSPTMRHSLLSQLHCHAVFASQKPRWDLESWRPDVGYLKTVLAACNP
jgi:hypothetical protein